MFINSITITQGGVARSDLVNLDTGLAQRVHLVAVSAHRSDEVVDALGGTDRGEGPHSEFVTRGDADDLFRPFDHRADDGGLLLVAAGRTLARREAVDADDGDVEPELLQHERRERSGDLVGLGPGDAAERDAL